MILPASSADMNACNRTLHVNTHQLMQAIERSGKAGKRRYLNARKRVEGSKT